MGRVEKVATCGIADDAEDDLKHPREEDGEVACPWGSCGVFYLIGAACGGHAIFTPNAFAALLAFATVASRKASCVATPEKMTQASPNLSAASVDT